MDYTSFELRLKQLLMNGNGPKLLLKLLESPFRFNSKLHPFNVLTRMEQSFLRTQENKYYKFIIECAEFVLNEAEVEHVENSYCLNYVDTSKIEAWDGENLTPEDIVNASEIIKFRAPLAFRNKDNTKLTLVFPKKRDIASKNEAAKTIEMFTKRIKALRANDKTPKVEILIWFVDSLYTRNEELYKKAFQAVNTEESIADVKYGSELFDEFNLRTQWDEIESYIANFKDQNLDFFLKMPDLNNDPETFEFMVGLSNSAWEKLSSDNPDMVLLRNLIFGEENDNSYTRARDMRNSKLVESVTELN
ncbi:HpyAIV family type II restriction enzyme [Mycoplasma zalophidermidis]|uniref:Uncharacterized protein n=1 Tax=Mycoplasma zalophidermidis TaxID=398174 RepID=A0ABS6DQY5_9MOLU|nr:hypothetical protein [Mycoplasma zalophidermidis]MBU4689542.1 hypothetical protein [Mycoplasma zalophidermidis]MBU4693420.1 hypothetical protein [Mycoplasma zalophidermidis]MCR8966283.1 hypothetical protein [Mycoplasma zalophidermidis]